MYIDICCMKMTYKLNAPTANSGSASERLGSACAGTTRDAEAGGKDDRVGIGDAPVLLLGPSWRKLLRLNPLAGVLRQMIYEY